MVTAFDSGDYLKKKVNFLVLQQAQTGTSSSDVGFLLLIIFPCLFVGSGGSHCLFGLSCDVGCECCHVACSEICAYVQTSSGCVPWCSSVAVLSSQG